MPLAIIIVALLIVGSGLVQAWTIWFLKREVQRLEFRLNEALDDEDLLEFQERLRALLAQAKETAGGLAETVDKSKLSLDKSLEKARQAEKSLALRMLAKAAAEIPPAGKGGAAGKNRGGKGGAEPEAGGGLKGKGKGGPMAVAKAPVKLALQAGAKPLSKPVVKAPENPRAAAPAPKPEAGRAKAPELPALKDFAGNTGNAADAEGEGPWASAREGLSGDARRSYLVRPQAPTPARYQKIYDLADQGLGLEQIAKHAGLLAGEVDLILNLRRKEPPSA